MIAPRPRFALAVLATAMACCTAAPSQPAGAPDWATMATAARTGPPAGAGETLAWQGADGKPVSLAVARPNPRAGAPTLQVAPSGDNRVAIEGALAQLKAAGGGTLRLAPGRYDLPAGPPALTLAGLRDVTIEGAGARLVFATWGDGILIRDVQRLAIRGLSVGYAQPAVIGATVRRGALVPDGGALAPGARVHQISSFDPAARRYPGGGKRVLLGQDGQALRSAAGALMLDKGLAGFADGDRVALKLSYYQGGAIRIADGSDKPLSQDITFQGITVRDGPGAGLVVDMMGRGLAVLDSQFGAAGGGGAIAFDALHVTGMTGDILIRGNAFTGSGDDAINLSSRIYEAALGADARTLAFEPKNQGLYPGARLALFDAGLRLVGTGEIASRTPRDGAGRTQVLLAQPVRAQGVRYVRNIDLLASRYAVIGNRIADCQCHGILAQGPNGLLRGNTFAGLRYNAIRLLTSGWWHEGSGAQNVVVERNRIRDTGDDDRRGVVWAAIAVYGELAPAGGLPQAPIAPTPVNAWIAIRDNEIDGVDQGCISVASARDVTLQRNTCSGFNRRVDRGRLLLERADVGEGMRRLPAKTSYLARGDGIWIDPLSTLRVAAAAR